MTITTVSSRELNQDIGNAKRCALNGPVFITDRGTPSHVLLSMNEYERLTQNDKNILELLSMPATDDIEFDPQPIGDDIHQPAEFD